MLWLISVEFTAPQLHSWINVSIEILITKHYVLLKLKNHCRAVVLVLLVNLDLANKMATDLSMCLFFNLEPWDDGLVANAVYVYCRSSLFLRRCQWSPSKRKLHWNVERKTPWRRKGKRPTLLIFACIPFFNLGFFCPWGKEVHRAVSRISFSTMSILIEGLLCIVWREDLFYFLRIFVHHLSLHIYEIRAIPFNCSTKKKQDIQMCIFQMWY